MTGSELLSWFGIGYAAAFVLGITMLLIGLLGLGGDHDVDHDMDGVDHDADADSDGDGDADGDGSGIGHSLLDFLGFGRCPFSVIVMCFCFLFALVGVVSVILLHMAHIPDTIVGAVSYPAAFVASFLMTGVTARVIGRLLPTKETSVESEAAHVGAIGHAVFDFDAGGQGFVQVRDVSGTIHELRARNGEKETAIQAGDTVVVTDYDVADRTFQVQKAPNEIADETEDER